MAALRVVSLPRNNLAASGLKPDIGANFMSMRPSTTLADLLTLLLFANPFPAVRASLRWSSEEFEDGVAYGGQGRLGRRPVASFFPALLS